MAVARSGHFTRAAQDIHLAQPTLSRQIASLEKDLGAVLFHRARGNITLSAAGEALLPIAMRMLADADLARQEVAEVTELRSGRVRLGATPSLCVSVVADLLERYRDAYPGIELHVTEGGSRGLVEELISGQLDFALIVDTEGDVGSVLELEPLYHEELVVVSASEGEPLTRRAAIRLAELARNPLVVLHESYDLRIATDAAFAAAGLRQQIAVQGGELDAVLAFVERGMGAAVVPALAAFSRPGLRAVRLEQPVLQRTICWARRTDVSPSHATRALRLMLRGIVNEMTEGEFRGLTRA